MTDKRGIVCFFFIFSAFIAFSQDVPRWFSNREAVYPSAHYITGLGDGNTPDEARTRALTHISMYFNTSVQAETGLLETYQETSRNGRTGYTHNTEMSESALVNTQADFFCVTFEHPYTDRKKTVYVLAKINRAEALGIYDTRIKHALAQASDIASKNENSRNPYAANKKLRNAHSIAELAAGYVNMAVLIDGTSASRYTPITALIPRIASAIEENKKRMTVIITLNDDRVNSLALKTAAIFSEEGFVVVDSDGTYHALLNVILNENKTQNYHTVQPLVDITFKLNGGESLARFQNEYAVFRHVNLNDAIGRALRNIEQDFFDDFAGQVRRIEE